MKTVLVLGPNPAWQKTLTFSRLLPGEVNRACSRQEAPSGKGINFCKAMAIHGKTTPFLIQFTGGENGKFINKSLPLAGKTAFDSISIRTEAPTRCCITCLDQEQKITTELIEPSFAATPEEPERYLQAISQKLTDPGVSAIALCGTLPTGTDPELYPRAAALAARKNIPVFADSYRNFSGLMASGADVFLKINAAELKELSGESSIPSGISQLLSMYKNLRFAAITNGADNALASDGKSVMEYEIPRLQNVINPIGSGDTASAVFAAELLTVQDPFAAFKSALACACANCLTSQPGEFDPVEAQQIISTITIKLH